MNTSQMTTIDLVDELGSLKAQQSELAKVEKELKAAIDKRMGRSKTNELDGEFFRVVRVTATRESLDTAEVKRLLVDPPMKLSTAVSFRVHSRIS